MQNQVATINDGWDVAETGSTSNLIRGKILKFADGKYTAEKTTVLPIGTELVAIDVTTAWVRWGGDDGKPTEHRVTYAGQNHPGRHELGDDDLEEWPAGLDGKPADVWRDTRYMLLIHPKTGQEYTFVTDSWGGRKAIGTLKDQIRNVRAEHPNAVPIVKLMPGTMKTKYGIKPAPLFEVTDWKRRGESMPTSKALDDDIPF